MVYYITSQKESNSIMFSHQVEIACFAHKQSIYLITFPTTISNDWS